MSTAIVSRTYSTKACGTRTRSTCTACSIDAVYLDLDHPTALYRVLKEPLLPLRPVLDGCTWVTDGASTRGGNTTLIYVPEDLTFEDAA
ncbi:MAG: hypothetical protein ACRDIE_02170 [Chloroflexota bacterium]